MPNSVPYVLLVIVLCACSFFIERESTRRTKAIASYLAIFSFTFFFAFRGYIMSDWIVYYRYFEDFAWSDISLPSLERADYVEPGFVLLVVLIKTVWNDYFFFQIVVFVIVFALFFRFSRRYFDNVALSLILFVTFEGLVMTVNLLRNSIAIMIFLNCIGYLRDRRPLPYFAGILVAVCFHVSSVVYFPIYFFFHKKTPRWLFITIFAFCNVIFLAKISVFLPIANLLGVDSSTSMKVKAYIDNSNSSITFSLGYFERMFTALLVLCYYDKLSKVSRSNNIFINGLLAYFICFFCLGEFAVLAKRLATLFAFGYWMTWYHLLKCFTFKNNRYLFEAFVYLYCILRMNGSTLLPDFKYENILFDHQNYHQRLHFHDKTFEAQ